MTAKEIREYRSLSKKLVEIEEKSKLLEQLKKRRVCLNEEEAFVHKLLGKFKVLGNKKLGRRGNAMMNWCWLH